MGGKRRRVLGEGEAEENQLEYEKERNAMMEQNRQRMLELGLLNLADKLAAGSSPRSKAARLAKQKPNLDMTPPGPVRRSSRLKGTPAVSYNERSKSDDEDGSKRRSKWGEGSKPEIYTEEDEKLLGTFGKPWELFVDGCDSNGSRIYDPSKGKTCHQCRQKTLGHRTSCSSCKALQGQFCGDCLFMRYGENVLETAKNPKWICPICRGICNCSLCRPKRGWPPTGALYRKASALGYKSVAHYLILTRRAIPIPP